MHRPRHSRRATLFGSLAVGITVMVTTLAMAQPGAAAPAGLHPLKGAGARQSALYGYLQASTAGTARNATSQATTPTNTHQGDDDDLADTMAAYNLERTAPAGYLTGDAIGAAAQQAAGSCRRRATGSSSPPSRTTASRPIHRPVLVEHRRRLLPGGRPGHRPGDHSRRLPGSRARPTAACGAPTTRARTGPRSPTSCPTCRPGRWRSTRRTARCGWAPARPTSRRTPTRAMASTGRQQRRPLLAERGRPGRPDRRPRTIFRSPSTRMATPTRRPTTGCSAGTRREHQWSEILDPAGADRLPAL